MPTDTKTTPLQLAVIVLERAVEAVRKAEEESAADFGSSLDVMTEEDLKHLLQLLGECWACSQPITPQVDRDLPRRQELLEHVRETRRILESDELGDASSVADRVVLFRSALIRLQAALSILRLGESNDLPRRSDLPRSEQYQVKDPPDIEELKRSLFESTYSHPITVTIKTVEDNLEFQIVVTSIRSKFVQTGYIGSSLTCHETPDWDFRGWIPKSGFDPFGEVIWVKLDLFNEGTEAFIERIPPPHGG